MEHATAPGKQVENVRQHIIIAWVEVSISSTDLFYNDNTRRKVIEIINIFSLLKIFSFLFNVLVKKIKS